MSLSLEEGSIVEGKVTKIKPFGALVQLPGNIQGLVHISHISASYVQNVDEFVSIGDIVKVKILYIDTKTNKVSLSIKDAVEKPPLPPKKEAGFDHYEPRNQNAHTDSNSSFEDKFKEYVKASNERLAGLNKRNKKR